MYVWEQEIAKGKRELAHKAAATMGDWLNRYRWTWFFTGTRREGEARTVEAMRYAFFWFMKQVSRREKVPAGSFYGIESFGSGAGSHVHGLIFIDWQAGPPQASDYWKLWFDRYGRNRIEFYNYDKGASWYCAKYLVKQGVQDHGVTGTESWKVR